MRSPVRLPNFFPKAFTPRVAAPLCGAVFAVLLAGCGGSPTAPARDDIFYLHGGGVIDRNYSWETYFKQLDQKADERTPRIVGVGVLNGDVRFGRPVDWY